MDRGGRDTSGEQTQSGRRLATIDVLRGFAILWVVMYHLWAVVTLGLGFLPARHVYYERLVDRVQEGRPLQSLTALTDVFFVLGDHGVTMFMILSGLSLTLVALRGSGTASPLPFYRRRLPRLLIPYWFAWLVVLGSVAALAWYRAQYDFGSFHENLEFYGSVRLIRLDDAYDALWVIPRGLSLGGYSALPQPLWFVLLLLQYYLMFPLLLPVLKRLGPLLFTTASLVITTGALLWMIWSYGEIGSRGYAVNVWAPFRMYEFALGMTLGYAIVHYWDRLRATVSGAIAMALLAAALIMHSTGAILDHDGMGYWRAIATPLVISGLALVCLLLIVSGPRLLTSSHPARIVAFVGTISYGVLIMNEPLRVVNTYLVLSQQDGSAGWWFFIVAVYVPLTVALAYPVSVLLGLVPRPAWWPRHRTRGADASATASPIAEAPSGPV